jgi:hypothetical protein
MMEATEMRRIYRKGAPRAGRRNLSTLEIFCFLGRIRITSIKL